MLSTDVVEPVVTKALSLQRNVFASALYKSPCPCFHLRCANQRSFVLPSPIHVPFFSCTATNLDLAADFGTGSKVTVDLRHFFLAGSRKCKFAPPGEEAVPMISSCILMQTSWLTSFLQTFAVQHQQSCSHSARPSVCNTIWRAASLASLIAGAQGDRVHMAFTHAAHAARHATEQRIAAKATLALRCLKRCQHPSCLPHPAPVHCHRVLLQYRCLALDSRVKARAPIMVSKIAPPSIVQFEVNSRAVPLPPPFFRG